MKFYVNNLDNNNNGNSAPFSCVDVGVLFWNMENVLDIPLKLLFMKFAVAWDDDENNDPLAAEHAALAEVTLVPASVGVMMGLLTSGVEYDVEYDEEYDVE